MVSKVCVTCGSDRFSQRHLIYCDKCNEYGIHMYCLEKKDFTRLMFDDDLIDFTWCCEDCLGIDPPVYFSNADHDDDDDDNDDLLVTEEEAKMDAAKDDDDLLVREEQVPETADNSEFWCFVCKDGGSLIICDHPGCTKVYHRKCVRGKKNFTRKFNRPWICGKHRCAMCRCTESEDISLFSCLCCTFALCESCRDTKTTSGGGGSDFAVVRNKETSGLCNKCLELVKLVEENAKRGLKGDELDLEDPDTFECRFKECWEIIKKEEGFTMRDVCFRNLKKEVGFQKSVLGKRKKEEEADVERVKNVNTMKRKRRKRSRT